MRILVREIRGNCPIFKLGDEIQIQGAEIDLERTRAICVHALPSLLYYALALREGADPRSLGLSNRPDRGYLQCPDPGPPYTPGGTVIFEFIL